jgi:hypothetical protein
MGLPPTGKSANAAPAVRLPVIEVGRTRIQRAGSGVWRHDWRPRSFSRRISASDSISSVTPLTTTLHPEWVLAS